MKTITILNSMKSGYFMLVVCAILLLGVTACSSEEFGIETPEVEKELTIDELIEKASRLMPPRTRGAYTVTIATNEINFNFDCYATKDMIINWGDDSTTSIVANKQLSYSHTYTDGESLHFINIEGPDDAIEDISLPRMKILLLNITYSTMLQSINLEENYLKTLDLSGCHNLNNLWIKNNNFNSIDLTMCPKLKQLSIENNNFTSLDITNFPYLENLYVCNNQLTNINTSENPNLKRLWIKDNPISNIDLCNNLNLQDLWCENNPITDLNLTNNKELVFIYLNNIPIKTINNRPIDSTTFNVFSKLEALFLENSPFTSLDLSKNQKLILLDISFTDITQLDLLDIKLQRLYASKSNLTKIKYNRNCLLEMCHVDLCATPFMQLSDDEIFMFLSSLPDRSSFGTPGIFILGNISPFIEKYIKSLEKKNWYPW